MSQAFDLLNKKLRQYIYEQGWQELRPIQAATIKHSLNSDHNFIISAPTAAGKTEAAFLPAINAVDNFDNGLKIVYISPLVALLNDQFKRLFQLCQDLDIPVTVWHGEASYSKKQKLLKNPSGILLITPESLEAMLVLRRGQAIDLFAATEWVIVDELHSFLASNRGIQLKSIIERLKAYHHRQPRYVAMSATLNKKDFTLAKEFFNSERRTDVIVDGRRNGFQVTIDYFMAKQDSEDKIIHRIFQLSQKQTMLVFPNSRALVEKIAYRLKSLAEKTGSSVNYFAHHASLSRDTRLLVESFAKEADNELFTICATSTLELGIDIGSVDAIVQYNAPFSASSLAQRLGRCGRRGGDNYLYFMSLEPYELLQGLACIDLYRQELLESCEIVEKPFDVLAHQILALLLEYSGIKFKHLQAINQHLQTFAAISDDEINRLLEHLIKQEYIEIIDDEAIIGIKAEKLLRAGDFYTQFIAESNYNVYSKEKKIGELPLTFSVQLGEKIYLAAKSWKIVDISYVNKLIRVQPALDGKPPVYIGSGGNVSRLVRHKMYRIIYDIENSWPADIVDLLNKVKEGEYQQDGYYFAEKGEKVALITYEGTRVNLCLKLMFNIVSQSNSYSLDDHRMAISGDNLKENLQKLRQNPPDKLDIYNYLNEHQYYLVPLLSNVKYIDLLPTYLQLSYAVNVCLDIEGALEFLEKREKR